MPEWKGIFTIIIAAVAVVLGGSGINGILSVIFQPDVNVAVKPDPDEKRASFQINNDGGSSATNVKLTVEAPSRIMKYNVFSSENYSDVLANSSVLELLIPRLIQGDGSDVRLNLWLDPKSTMVSDRYITYVTHDRGSEKVITPNSSTVQTEETIISFRYLELFAPIITLVGSVAAGVISYYTSSKGKHLTLFPGQARSDKSTNSISTDEFIKKISRLKDHGIISGEELNRIRDALTTKRSIALDELLDELSKLKD